jgi:hypothetical protein
MSQIYINTGNIANDGTGDPLRTAFNDVNTNFTQVFSAGPVGSNIAIANNTIQVTNSNGNLRLATNGIGVIVPAANFVPDVPNARYIGAATNRFNTIFSQYLNATTGTFSNNVYISGNLNVVGNTITNNYSNANIANLTLTLAGGSSNAALANGAGIIVNSANANFVYNNSANSWNSTIAITAPTFIGDGANLTNVNANINASNLLGNTLRSTILFSNLTSFGSIASISATGNISTTGNVYANTITANVINGTFVGDGGNLTNLTANAIVGNVPFALNANSAYTANLAALATQAINADTALFAINANLAAFANVATSAQTANTASYSVQSDNANSAVVAGMAYQIAPTANISVVGNITTSSYFIGNGSQLTGITAAADTGNIGFTGDTIYDLNGINLQNSDSTHGPTAAIIIPANGDTDAILLNNIYGNVILQSGDNANPTATWLFNNDGNLTLPSNIASINYANGQPYGGSGGTANTGNVTFDDINIIGTGNLHLQPDPTNAASYLDVFLTSGPDLHLVASANANLILGKDNDANVLVSWDGNVYVQSWSQDTGNVGGIWTFGGDGGTIFPTLSTQRGDNPSGTITGQTLLFGDSTQEAIISTPDGSNANGINSQRLVINPGKGEDSNGGEGGDIYLWAGRGGDNSGSGGDVKIRGGQGMGQYGSAGYLRIEAGDSQDLGDAGFIEITGGQGGNTYGGLVAITGGQGGNGSGGDVALAGGYGINEAGGDITINGGGSSNGLAEYGNIYIGSGASTWTFNNTGNLTLPDIANPSINFANGQPYGSYTLPLATNSTVGGVALGNGFTLNASNQVSTSSLYNTNLTQPTQHYALSVDTNGVVILPDQSIIDGSTLRAIAGSYAGLTTNDGENSWMWVDANGAYIATQYSETGNSHQWTFDNTGTTTFPTGGLISNYPGATGANNDSWFVTPGNGTGGVSSQDGQQYIQVNDDLFVEIGTGYGTANAFVWQFGLDGTFATSGNINTTGNVNAAGNVSANIFVLNDAGNATYSVIQQNQNSPYGSQAYGIQLLTTTDDANVFGSISAGPDYVTLQSTNAGNANVIAQGGYGVTISTSNATGAAIKEWSFVSSGDTYFPGSLDTDGNILSQGEVSAIGNITTDGYFVGTFVGNVTGNFVIPGANTQVVFNTNGNADATAGMTFVKGSNLFTVLGTVSAQGNVQAGNILTSNIISAGGNITGAYFIGNGSQLTNLPAPTVTQDITSNGYMSLMTYDGNIKYVNNATVEPSSGNLHVAGNISAVGNISANNIGNVATLNLNGNGNTVLYGNGVFAAVTGGGGNANTGNVTFDDINIIGTGNLHLQPDPANAASYLDIFLTSGPDLHIASNDGSLILGEDAGANVMVGVSPIGNVSIQSWNGYTSTANVWNFGTDGYLTFPRDVAGNTDPYLLIQGGPTPTISSVDVSLAGPANLDIVSNFAVFSGFNGNTVSIYADDGEISSTANLQIWANSGGNTEYSWTFDNTGNLTTSSNLVIGPGPGGGSSVLQYDAALQILGEGANSVVQMGWTANQSAPDSVTTIAMNYPGGGEGNVLIAVGNNATTVNYWLFDNTGNLRLPGNTFAVNYANGTQVSIGGGGNASTGNVTFDNQIVIGTGDGFGDGGLYLAVGPTSVANLQYLQVRGGDVATHIHLDTGNSDFYDQYFGNDGKYVKLEAGAEGNVVIGTDGDGYNWTFDDTGNLTVPGNIKTTIIGPAFSSNVTDVDTTTTPGLVIIGLADNVFTTGAQGQVTITGVVGTTEANGTWYYQTVETNAIQLFSDPGFTIPVNGTLWTAYVSGGLAVAQDYYRNLSITGGAVSIVNSAGNAWTFGSAGNLLLAPQNVSGGAGESAILSGTRKIINGQYSGASYGYSAVLAAGGTPTVAYTATNEYVQSVRLTFAVESIGVAPQWEQFDVVATKSLDTAEVNFVVSNRIKARSSIPDTVVTASYGSANEIEIILTLAAGQTSGWSSFDAVEFGLMFN